MPELPEVETTLRGIAPYITGKTVAGVSIRTPKLRYPIPKSLRAGLKHQTIQSVRRRAKYLLVEFQHGTLMIHLGMSGRLSLTDTTSKPQKHDHFDLCFSDQSVMRLTDPRRFGMVLWTNAEPNTHPLLEKLGPEPLSLEFHKNYLYQQAQRRRSPLKTLIMDSKIVVGVGNIYANEALFQSHLHPSRPANQLNINEASLLVKKIKQILKKAIQKGGTTLKDFHGTDGKPGYFQQKLTVYGRDKDPCIQCSTPIQKYTLGQRSTFYCPHCQS